jgi:hypothetical protein
MKGHYFAMFPEAPRIDTILRGHKASAHVGTQSAKDTCQGGRPAAVHTKHQDAVPGPSQHLCEYTEGYSDSLQSPHKFSVIFQSKGIDTNPGGARNVFVPC